MFIQANNGYFNDLHFEYSSVEFLVLEAIKDYQFAWVSFECFKKMTKVIE